MYDYAVVGAGVLGHSIAYWLRCACPDASIVVLDKEPYAAFHASGRNSGVVHRPFYLHPERKSVFARAALLSYALWKDFAHERQLPWEQVGTLMCALRSEDVRQLEMYEIYALVNGMKATEWRAYEKGELREVFPHVQAEYSIFFETDAVVDFGWMTRSLCALNESLGVEVQYRFSVDSVHKYWDLNVLNAASGNSLCARYVVNCAGAGALGIAQMFQHAQHLACLYFRGDYWRVRSGVDFADCNIYTVPQFSDFPFLDPHWIQRVDGTCEIGPTAVPVLHGEAYRGSYALTRSLIGCVKSLHPNILRVLRNPTFVRLARSEWESAVSRRAFVRRVQKFLPEISVDDLDGPGVSGIRSCIVDTKGQLVPEALMFSDQRSFHVLNYNSPGATGAPAFGAHVVSKILQERVIQLADSSNVTISDSWDFQRVSEAMNV